eukprot:1458292-Rhodomonas_salina.1
MLLVFGGMTGPNPAIRRYLVSPSSSPIVSRLVDIRSCAQVLTFGCGATRTENGCLRRLTTYGYQPPIVLCMPYAISGAEHALRDLRFLESYTCPTRSPVLRKPMLLPGSGPHRAHARVSVGGSLSGRLRYPPTRVLRDARY